jgi:hypothetical protein
MLNLEGWGSCPPFYIGTEKNQEIEVKNGGAIPTLPYMSSWRGA